jgi:hypothetical protein
MNRIHVMAIMLAVLFLSITPLAAGIPTDIPASRQETQNIIVLSSLLVAAGLIVIASVGISAYLVVKSGKQPAMTIEAEWEKNGKTYLVPVEKKGDKLVLPFLTQEEPKNNLWRRDWKNAKVAVRACMNNPYYRAEIERLISAGTIPEKIGNKEKAS